MSTSKPRLFWLIAAFVVLAVAAAAVFLLGDWETGGDVEKTGLFSPPPTATVDQPDQDLLPAIKETAAGPSDPTEDEIAREAVKPAGLFITGRVTDKATGDPIPEFHLRLARRIERFHPVPDSTERTIRDEQGRFAIPVDSSGRFTLSVSTSHYQQYRENLAVIAETGDLHIELEAGSSLVGRVVDDSTSAPVADALIVTSTTRSSDLLDRLISNSDIQSGVNATTDERGSFTLRGLADRNQRIMVLHPDYVQEVVVIDPEKYGEIEFRLETGFSVYGTAYDDSGNPAVGIVVTMMQGGGIARPAVSGSDGSYRTPPASAADVILHAYPPFGETVESSGFTQEEKMAAIIDRDVKVDFGPTG